MRNINGSRKFEQGMVGTDSSLVRIEKDWDWPN